MSLFSLLSQAVAVPLALIVVVFFWFLLRAQIAGFKKRWDARRLKKRSPQPAHFPASNFSSTAIPSISIQVVAPNYVPVQAAPSPPEYQPLAHFLGNTTTTAGIDSSTYQFDLKDIPGINDTLKNALHHLGYTSIEQIARWGRADVRVVSASLGIEQQKIEEEWIEGARLILSIR